MVNQGEGAFQRARQVGEAAAQVGFDWPSVEGALEKVGEELEELWQTLGGGDEGRRRQRQQEELGDLLFSVVNVARHLKLDLVTALEGATDRFEARFERVGALAARRGAGLKELALDELEELWQEAKLDLSQERR